MILSFVAECRDCFMDDYHNGTIPISPEGVTITYGITHIRPVRALVARCPNCHKLLDWRDLRSGSGVYNGKSITDEQLIWLLRNINLDYYYEGWENSVSTY